ncbi:MAG: YhcH/YjgK/YiaL family protein, partial [Prevotellaceae bacterium]|nr:YhcH/YjgK/YiaL family protein [Prevotellaceae bacterium]
YIDVQIPLTASETVGWKPLAALTTAATEPFDAARDIAFYRERAQAYLPVHPGQFYIMFPEDAHAPIIGTGRIKKLIGKILI